MDCCRISDFDDKEVINLCDGARLGTVCDVIFEKDTGRIVALIVPAKKEGLLERRSEYEIPWCDVERIGDDYIFVRYQCPSRLSPRRRGFTF